MRRTLCAIAVLVWSIGTAHAFDANSFGFRMTLGGISGIDDGLRTEAGLMTDMNLLSEQIRLTFGPTFVFPGASNQPIISIHMIGLEYNLPLGEGTALAGIRYFRAYLADAKAGFLGGKRGWVYLLGYKHHLEVSKDIVVLAGWMDQPVRVDPAQVNLRPSLVFVRAGLEWYF